MSSAGGAADLIAVMGNPSFSLSILTFFRATRALSFSDVSDLSLASQTCGDHNYYFGARLRLREGVRVESRNRGGPSRERHASSGWGRRSLAAVHAARRSVTA